ncbi:hypothetical protein E2C01_102815 [Portunus trituberculatus]|uniref:Uncharacterized protein n=1 Tax=Portunus trituberculatus TaxID=210409 RepID=A0A5B7KJE2_PORTR|nr:hypothetical protein [Portunus trituberculatus]
MKMTKHPLIPIILITQTPGKRLLSPPSPIPSTHDQTPTRSSPDQLPDHLPSLPLQRPSGPPQVPRDKS